jgi:hypothetical protein
MFKPCPKCGFLVALIAGREASQRCPRCGSALVTESELLEMESAAPSRRPLQADGGEPRSRADQAVVDSRDTGAPVSMSARDAAATDDDGGDAYADAPQGIEALTDTVAEPAATATGPDATVAPLHDGPSFARRRARVRSGRPRWPWVVGIAALALLLAAQLLLAQRVELARDATWRPLVTRACGVLGCDVPVWHEPQAYAMLARGVRPSGTRRGVLHVNATVRNDARWPQAPPVVVLSLSDVDGRVVGARAVTPAEYGHRGDSRIAPGDSVDITFDVREPSAHVESFDFQLQ